jgi:hypothetical protein
MPQFRSGVKTELAHIGNRRQRIQHAHVRSRNQRISQFRLTEQTEHGHTAGKISNSTMHTSGNKNQITRGIDMGKESKTIE